MAGAERHRGSERRFQNYPAHWAFRCKRNRYAGAERFTPQHKLLRWVAPRRETISGLRIGNQPLFAGAASRAAVATIFQCDQADAVGDKSAKTGNAKVQRSALAVEIDDDRFVVARRHVPSRNA